MAMNPKETPATTKPPEYRMVRRGDLRNQAGITAQEVARGATPRRRGLVVPQGGDMRTAADLDTSPAQGAAVVSGMRPGRLRRMPKPDRRVSDAVASARPNPTGPSHAVLAQFIRDNGMEHMFPGASMQTPQQLLERLNIALARQGQPPYGAASAPGKRRRWFARRDADA